MSQFYSDADYKALEHRYAEVCGESLCRSRKIIYLKKENEKLRECVEFYADRNTVFAADLEISSPDIVPQTTEEVGSRARKTLEEIKGR